MGKKIRLHEDRLIILGSSGAFLALYIKFGIGTEFLYYGILLIILVVISEIDIKTYIIPNKYILAGCIWGITFNIFGIGIEPMEGIYGAIAGGAAILAISLLSLLLFKKPGMGGGDVKLMGMAGLFLGWKLILLSILLAIYIAGIVFIILLAKKKITMDEYVPFGPYLAMGITISLLLGEYIISWYLSML